MAKNHVIVEDVTKHLVMRKREFTEPDWKLPKATEIGYVRGFSKGLYATAASISWVTLPFGQGTPVHHNSAEHIIVNLEGQLEFRFVSESVELSPMDLLFIPANYQYSYFNVGVETVRFFSVLCRYDEWPGIGNYDYPQE
jgi:mannose-6-phosphate isomerase-like protein (cupin superfamily)